MKLTLNVPSENLILEVNVGDETLFQELKETLKEAGMKMNNGRFVFRTIQNPALKAPLSIFHEINDGDIVYFLNLNEPYFDQNS